MKKYGILLVFMLISSLIIGWKIITNDEVYWPQKQKFEKPVIEKDSKVGPWTNSPNIGSVDPKNYVMFSADFFEHSMSNIADKDIWLSSVGCTVENDKAGGQINFIPYDAATTKVTAQVNGEPFTLNDKSLWYEIKLTPQRLTKTIWFMGLANDDTDIMGGGQSAAGVKDGATTMIGFTADDTDSTDVNFLVKDKSVSYVIDTDVSLSDSTSVRLGFMIDKSTSTGMSVYINDSQVALPCTAGLCTQIDPSSFVTPTMAVRQGLNAAALINQGFFVDYVRVIQKR